jgi:hypothetical protein
MKTEDFLTAVWSEVAYTSGSDGAIGVHFPQHWKQTVGIFKDYFQGF